MASFSQEVLEDIRAGNDLVEVVSAYVPLKQRGSSYIGLCPFHKEQTPSFSIKADEQFYHCFGCGAGGNVYGFIMQIENMGFVDAVKHLADRIRYTIPETKYSPDYKRLAAQKEMLYEIHIKAARFFYDKLNTSEGMVASQYLDKRRVLAGARKKFGLGCSVGKRDSLFQYLMSLDYDIGSILASGLVLKDNNSNYYDRFQNRLMFPIFDAQNKIVGFGGRALGDTMPKYLNSPDTLIFDKSKNLYGINLARLAKSEDIIIVEGYMDVISLVQAGFSNTSASLGTAFNAEHAKQLKKYCKNVILLFDSDTAGEKAVLRALPVMSANGLSAKVLQLTGAKDPDEFISLFGNEAFNAALKDAQSPTAFRISLEKRKYNLTDAGQKVMFANNAAKIISELPNAIEREVYIGGVSNISGVSAASISEEVVKRLDASLSNESARTYNRKPNIAGGRAAAKGADEAKRSVLFIMATRRDLCEKIASCLTSDEFYDKVYIQLYNIIKELQSKKMSLYPAEITNNFETPDEQKIVSKVFALNFKYETDRELITALNDQIGIIKASYADLRLSEETDIEKFIILGQMKRNAKNLYITGLDG